MSKESALAAEVAAVLDRVEVPLHPATDRARAVAGLAGWLTLVRKWNAKIDLTAAKTDAELAELGVLDAAHASTRIAAAGGTVVDVGTGFGAPGLALSVLRPDLTVRLVEPLGKRATFLRTVLGSLGLVGRVAVIESKGEDVVARGEIFGAAISRATLAPADWLALGDRLTPAGEVVVLLARDEPPAVPNRALSWELHYATTAKAPRRVVGYARSASP